MISTHARLQINFEEFVDIFFIKKKTKYVQVLRFFRKFLLISYIFNHENVSNEMYSYDILILTKTFVFSDIHLQHIFFSTIFYQDDKKKYIIDKNNLSRIKCINNNFCFHSLYIFCFVFSFHFIFL